MLDERTAKKLIAALDRNTEALEAGNKLTSAVLKASGRQAPSQQTQQLPNPVQKVYGA